MTDEPSAPRRPNPLTRGIARIAMSIRAKLLIAFLGITLLMVGLALFGLATLQQANSRTAQLIEDQQNAAIFSEIDSSLVTISMMAFAAAAFETQDPDNARLNWLFAPEAAIDGAMDNLQILLGQSVRRVGGQATPAGREITALRQDLKNIRPLFSELRKLRSAGDRSAFGDGVREKFAPAILQMQRAAFTQMRQIETVMAQRARTTQTDYLLARQRVWGVTIFAVGAAILLGFAISSSINWPLTRITRAVKSIARGNFDQNVQVPNKDEFGALATDITTMSHQLRDLYAEVDAQRAELASWNTELETKVAHQVDEIQRTNRLRRYLPEQVASMITSAGDDADVLASKRRTVTVLFADLRGFTAFSNAVAPETVISALNTFHAAVGPLIEAQGGTLERFLGDGLVVLFNAPVSCATPEAHALALGQAMQDAFHPAMQQIEAGQHQLGLGIGIATGEATLGQIGFEGRLDYAAIGTVPNLAARLCDIAADGQILICDTTASALTTPLRPVGPFDLKGISPAVPAFEPT